MKHLSIFITAFVFFFTACTDLDPEVSGSIDPNDGGSVDIDQLLNGAYSGLRNYQTQENLGALYTHTSDEMAGPTRGRDWDDAGIWRTLHLHTWTTAHAYINLVWNTANNNSYNAQQVICAGATGQQKAEATFLRAFNDFLVLDLFGKVPRRECGEDLRLPPSMLLLRTEAIDVIISELEAEIGNLPESTNPAIASKNAARALLAKLYLNKAVYKATDAEGAAQTGPYTFDVADMNKVIEYCDAITGMSLEPNYFSNFSIDNSETSSELIFVSQNTSGGSAGNVRAAWFQGLHYNQNPSGWNGFVALSDLYNKFETGDIRRGQEMQYFENNGSGLNAGFLIGQQYDANNTPLTDRQGSPLIFTSEFSLLESGDNLEMTGIRTIKYIPDFDTPGDAADNDYVIFRYADVRLMKAEAIMRGGSSSESAVGIVNGLRSIRNASTLSGVTEQDLLDERSRELYHEGWRRNDQIRFNTFLGTWQEKDSPSDPSRLLFPIPGEAISTNPELPQNPGY